MKEQNYIYILTNQHNKILYIGVTSDLVKRIYQHKNKLVDGFSKKYSLYKLVYYEVIDSIISAIEREKFLKKKTRNFKLNLINNFNPSWSDLYTSII
jgi:putative endonuclease